MNKEMLLQHQKKLYDSLIELSVQAQKEYVHNNNSFDNFERLSYELKLPREKVLWIYLKKHLDGILKYINDQKTQRDSIQGRISDAIVYLTILSAMYTEGTEPADRRTFDVPAPREDEYR